MATKKAPTPSVSAKAARLINEFEEASKYFGWDEDPEAADKEYDRARAALRRYIHQLENKTP